MTDSESSHIESPHFDEMTGLLYLEQQLDDARSKGILAHANTCESCRELLRVLKNEGVWLREAMLAEDEPIPAHLIGAPARHTPPWGWMAALGFGAAGAYTLWSGFVEPWMTQASDVGFTQGNLMTMLFFSGAFWNGWGDVLNLIEFTAVATLGAVAIWALRRYFRRQATVAAVTGLLGVLLMTPFTAHAGDTEHGTPGYTLPAGQEIKTDLIVTADRTQVDGDVDGDLVAFSHEVEVNGHVKGDILAFTQELRMNGTVDGNIRVFSQSAVVNGPVAKNLMAFVGTLDLTEKGSVGGSATIFSSDGVFNGPVKGDVLAFAHSIDLNNWVGGNIKIRGEIFRIASKAQLSGRTVFEGPKDPDVESGAKLASPIEVTVNRPTPEYSTARYYLHQIFWWGAAFVFGMVLLLVAPGVFLDATNQAKNVGPAMGVGLLFFAGAAFGGFIACITVVGLSVGIVLWLILAVAVYTAQIFVGEWIGEKLLGTAVGAGAILLRLAVGLAIIHVIEAIPIVRVPAALVVVMWGLGAHVMAVQKRMREQTPVAV
jgi:cytoskeletal protein CcmA (bactofilin family)